MTTGFFAAQATGHVMGDLDRTAFDFTKELTDTELLELLERNPRVKKLCKWMLEQAFTNGYTVRQKMIVRPIEDDESEKGFSMQNISTEDYLEQIHFDEKIIRGGMFARLHGSSMALFLNFHKDLSTTNGFYQDFEIHHKFAKENGWEILKVNEEPDSDDLGEPTEFKITTMTEKMTKKQEQKVTAERVIIIKNPKIGQRWDGTPDSKQLAHIALLEELIMKCGGKFALDRSNSFLHAQNVPDEQAASDFEDAVAKVPLNSLETGTGIIVEPKSFSNNGSAGDFSGMINILKEYMAGIMDISVNLLGGQGEGAGGGSTLSTATANIAISSSTVKTIQNHMKPYMEDILDKLGFDDPNIDFNDPTPDLAENPNDLNNDKEESEENGNRPEQNNGKSSKRGRFGRRTKKEDSSEEKET